MSRRAQAMVFGAVTACWALVLPLAAFMAVMSVMMTDAGVNEAIYAAMGLSFGWPVAILLCVIAGWVGYAFKRPRTAGVLFAAPAVYFVVMIAGVSILLDHAGPRHG